MGAHFSRFKYEISEIIKAKYTEWRGEEDDDDDDNDNRVTSFNATTPTKIPKSSGNIDKDLYRASETDNLLWVEKLLKLHANGIRPQGEHELTSLHVCMSAGVAARIVKSLPKSMWDKLDTIRDSRGNTPLHAAARSNRQEALLCLIECGFDLNEKNDAGRTPSRVAFDYHYLDTHRLCDQLLMGNCWCGPPDLEESCQLYVNIYSYRECCQDVYHYIMDQKTEDKREELEIRKKLSRLLESQAERKRWQQEKQEAAAKEQDGTDIKGALAKAMKEMEMFDREMKRREAAEQAGIEYVPKGADSDDSDDDEPVSPSKGKRKNEKKESVKSRIKALEKQLETVIDPTRWRACDNSLGFPHDIQDSASALMLPSLALHVRIGCSGRKYQCQWCQKMVMRSREEIHVKEECRESTEVCPQCKGLVRKRLLKHHLKNECLARDWVFCPNNCDREVKSSELRKHLSLECPNRKKKCKYCKTLVTFHLYQHHLVSDCSDRIAPCVVDGCDRMFHVQSDHDVIKMHQRAHLQKHVKQWTKGETAFWLETTFPFFGDFLINKYKNIIIEKNITGRILMKPSSAKELRKILMKNVGMPEDHAFTVSEAVVGRAPADERWAEHPKRIIRAGAYLSQDIRAGVKERVRLSPYKIYNSWK